MLLLGVLTIASASASASASELSFNSHFLYRGSADSAADLSALVASSDLSPGLYDVDVVINGVPLMRRQVRFLAVSGELQPCISADDMEWLGLNPAYFEARGIRPETLGCELLGAVEQGRVDFFASRLRLELTLPQASLRRSARDRIDPENWQQGVTALRLNYLLNSAWNSPKQGASYDDQYGDFRFGVDWNGWRARSSVVLSRDSRERSNWDSRETFLYRPIPAVRGELTLGESFTRSRVFDGVPYTGVQLRSDTAMLPVSQQGFSPVIRAQATSHARVTVRQNGFTIYSTFVPPGPFVIDDLPSLSNGDLEVTIEEQDGQVRRFIQPFNQLPNLVREGLWEYNLVLANYRSSSHYEPFFAQGELSRGLPGNITGYVGSLLSEDYLSGLAGVGLEMGGWGSVSVDVTHSQADLPDLGKVSGQSYRLLYAKSLASNTSLQLLGFRYSTEQFRTFQEAIVDIDRDLVSAGIRKQRMEANLSHHLGRHGSLYLNASRDEFWNLPRHQQQFTFGYNNNLGVLSYAVNVTDLQSQNGQRERLYGLSLSLPLDTARTRGYMDYRISADDDGIVEHGVGTGGVLVDAPEVSYNVQAGYRPDDSQSRASAQLAYAGNAMGARVGNAVQAGNQRRFAQVEGAVVAHQGGLLFGRRLSETAILAHVPEVEGAAFGGGRRPVQTNRQGYALIPTAQPYRYNRLRGDLTEVDPDVEISERTLAVVPTRGALALARFDAVRVQRFLVRLSSPEGAPLTLGSQIINSDGELVGMVTESGRAVITVDHRDAGEFLVRGERPCRFILPAELLGQRQAALLTTVAASCGPVKD